MSEQQIFIVGTGRSGTSILKRILGDHSQIFSYPNELRLISDNDGLIDLRNHFINDWNPHKTSQAVERFRYLLRRDLFETGLPDRILNYFFKKVFNGAGRKYAAVNLAEFIPLVHLERCLKKFTENITITQIEGHWYGSESYQVEPHMFMTKHMEATYFDKVAGKFLDELLSYPLSKNSRTCWCEDTPMNILYADVLVQMLEGARIIHIYRNPLDVVASYSDVKQKWAMKELEYSAGWIRDILNRWFNIRQSVPSDKYIEIKYEELVKDQVEGLKKITDFLNLEYEDSLMNTKLNDTAIERYKKDIPSEKLERIEQKLNPILEAYGYL